MLKKIFESTLIMGASSATVMAFDVVRVKVLAVLIGPMGVGTLSVLNQFHTLAVNIIGMGLGTGIVKYVSTLNHTGDVPAVKNVLSSAFQLIFIVALLIAGITVLLREFLSNWIVGDPGYSNFIVIYAVSLPLAVYPLTTSSFLQGLKRVGPLAKINALKSCISLTCIVPLIYIYELEGAIYSVLVGAVVHISLNKFFLGKENNSYCAVSWKPLDTDILKKLLPYGLATLLTGATYSLSHLLLKIIIVQELGVEINGLYQPVWALTMTYLTLVLSSMATYSYPRLCELQNDYDISEEVNGILRIALLMIMPVMFLLLLARQPIIQLLYSSSFLPVAKYMPVQIVGDFFKVLTWSVGAFLLPTHRLSAFIWLGVLTDAVLVILAFILIKQHQLHGATVAFALSYLFSFAAHYLYGKMQIGLRLWNKNRKLIFLSLCALSAIIISDFYLSQIPRLVAGCASIAAWCFLSVEKNEVRQLKNYLSEKLGKP